MFASKSLLAPDHRPLTTFLIAALLLPPAMARGQAGAPAVEAPSGSTPSNTKKFADLTIRYRFSERYTTEEDKAAPGMVCAYRVAILDVVRDSVESSQGAPKRTETNRQVIFAERPAETAAGIGNVTSTVRAVERFQAKLEDASKMMGSRPLEGATVLVRPRLGELPTILSLAEDRSLTDYEYEVFSKQAFVPQLAGLMPGQSVRLGDTWRIPRRAAQALLGDPTLQGDTLVGKLAEVRKEVEGPRMVASVSITGKIATASGETTVNAEVLFTFQGSMIPRDESKKSPISPGSTEGVMDSKGAITEIRLATITSGPLPGPGRLRFQSNRELTLHRQLGVVAGGAALPALPSIPEPSESNTWLTHVEPQGRYQFKHPQDLLAAGPGQAVRPNTTLLVRTRRDGRDMLQLEFVRKTLAVEDLKKQLAETYGLLKMELIQGDESWLPEAEWPGMRVYRVDAALKLSDSRATGPGGPNRIHFDGYLIQFAQTASIVAIASTSREAVAPYREEVEKILKSIQLDPPRPISK